MFPSITLRSYSFLNFLIACLPPLIEAVDLRAAIWDSKYNVLNQKHTLLRFLFSRVFMIYRSFHPESESWEGDSLIFLCLLFNYFIPRTIPETNWLLDKIFATLLSISMEKLCFSVINCCQSLKARFANIWKSQWSIEFFIKPLNALHNNIT